MFTRVTSPVSNFPLTRIKYSQRKFIGKFRRRNSYFYFKPALALVGHELAPRQYKLNLRGGDQVRANFRQLGISRGPEAAPYPFAYNWLRDSGSH